MRAKRSIGERVVAARAAMEPPMTQTELLKRLQSAGVDMPLERLQAIENGTRGPRLLELMTMADILGKTDKWLMTGEAR